MPYIFYSMILTFIIEALINKFAYKSPDDQRKPPYFTKNPLIVKYLFTLCPFQQKNMLR
jgi:hypothetical protein